ASQSVLNIAETTGVGSELAEIERNGDTDLFRFSPPASGQVTINATATADSSLLPRVRVFDTNMVELTDAFLGGQTDTGTSASTAVIPLALRNQDLFVVVQRSVAPGVAATRVGEYTLTVTAPPVDDHANITEFDLASLIIISPATGEGAVGEPTLGAADNPQINPAFETDLFSFTTLEDGDVTITLTTLGGAPFRGDLVVFDADENQIATATAASAGDVVTITLSDAITGSFFLLVSDAGQSITGEYELKIASPIPMGTGPGGGGGGDGPEDDVDFNNPIAVPLASQNGDGDLEGSIDEPGDRDLFIFTAPADGRVFVQVTTPSGSLLDASVTVFDEANEDDDSIVLFDASGVPGATANGSFDGVGGTTYYIIVDGIGAGTGSYTVRIDASPETHFLYYPEGFTSPTINAFVSIANANEFDVSYTVIARYETGERDQILRTGSLAAGQRGGLDLSRGTDGSPVNLRPGAPFSIEIQSDGPLGATLAHYDFGATLGDAFTDQPGEDWVFPRLERTSGVNFDFVLFYNPNPFDVTVSLTGYDAGGNAVTIEREVEAFRRGGYNLDTITQFPTGIFSGVLTAEATDDANDSSFIGVVSSLSHFDLGATSGFASLGDASGGSTNGALTSIESGSAINSEVVFFNPNDTNTTITLRGEYLRVDLPDLLRVIELEPRETLVLSGPAIGLAPNQPAGIAYSASGPISVLGVENQFGDANSVDAASEASQIFFFGDAFIAADFAGDLYFETLNFYNPAAQPLDVEVELLFFNDPNPTTVTVSLNGGGFGELVLHELPEIVDRGGLVAYSIQVSASRPFVVSLEHYDLFLLGGWQTLGAPVGLSNPIASVLA
ncbi:MAG: hypothetical protein AAGK04_13445, partial [Planctomycetota bacterium]